MGVCKGFLVSECRDIQRQIYAENAPSFCIQANKNSLPKKESWICEARNQISSNPSLQAEIRIRHENAALVREQFNPLLSYVEAMAVSVECNITDSQSTYYAISQIHEAMNEIAFRAGVGSAQGIDPEESVRAYVRKGKEIASKDFCLAISPIDRSKLRSLVQEVIRTYPR